MADLAAIRAGIAANLSLAFGSAIAVYPYMISNPMGPFVYVINGPTKYDLAMHRGSDELHFIVRVGVPYSSDQGGQIALDLMLTTTDALSVKNAVESDPTLGATVSWARVTDASEPKLVQHDQGPPMLSVDFMVEAMI